MLNSYRIYIKDQPIGFTVYAEFMEIDDDLICFGSKAVPGYTTLIQASLVLQVVKQNPTYEIIYQAPIEKLESVVS